MGGAGAGADRPVAANERLELIDHPSTAHPHRRDVHHLAVVPVELRRLEIERHEVLKWIPLRRRVKELERLEDEEGPGFATGVLRAEHQIAGSGQVARLTSRRAGKSCRAEHAQQGDLHPTVRVEPDPGVGVKT